MPKELLDRARGLLAQYTLCRGCLERQFPELVSGSRDEEIEEALTALIEESHGGECYICRGLLPNLKSLGGEVLASLKGHEFGTFVVGVSLPNDYLEREDALRARLKLRGGEPLKSAISRGVGRIVAARMGGARVSFSRPEAEVLVDLREGKVTVKPRSIFLWGRYVKKGRGIVQKKARCPTCFGKGCAECSLTGFFEAKSVEALLEARIKGLFDAQGARFTWFGGEDGMSLVLGKGRPFYAEVLSPKIRRLEDGKPLEGEVGEGVELREARALKEEPKRPPFFVSVRANFVTADEVGRERLKDLEGIFADTKVMMRSTKGKLLEKRVQSMVVEAYAEKKMRLSFGCDGGLNIRRFITGDEGDVRPSISEVLGCSTSVDDGEPFDILDVTL